MKILMNTIQKKNAKVLIVYDVSLLVFLNNKIIYYVFCLITYLLVSDGMMGN